jgi:7-cyano-7-deazaguanine synthase in queuosine biosynthesis
MLLSAALEAASLGLSRIIWPIHAGAAPEVDVAALADVCDRALLAGQLVGLDLARLAAGATPTRGVRIETPYADLTDAELMDLALDMDVPLHACWWCMNEDAKMCGQCSGCMRWREALRAVDPAAHLDIQVLADNSGPRAAATS